MLKTENIVKLRQRCASVTAAGGGFMYRILNRDTKSSAHFI